MTDCSPKRRPSQDGRSHQSLPSRSKTTGSNKDARTPAQGHHKRQRVWEAVWPWLWHVSCPVILGARQSHSQLARAVGEVLWGAKQSKRNQGGFLSLGKCFEGQRPSSCFSPPSLLLTGRLRTSCALSWYLNEETQSRRNTGLLKSLVNPTSAEMKSRPQKLQL